VKKLLIAVLVAMPLAGCTETVVNTTPTNDASADAGTVEETPDAAVDAEPPPVSQLPQDRCLDGQDMDGPDVDVSSCPALPNAPASTLMGQNKVKIELGAWEMGTLSNGETYKYGSLSAASTNPRMLNYDTGSVAVNAENLSCWAKGYYRLRRILQNPPAEYVALHKAGFQYRFFQFQSDLRNGPTGYKKISSFEDHLVKWVTVINAQGVCEQPTLTKFRDYAKAELTRRKLPLPEGS